MHTGMLTRSPEPGIGPAPSHILTPTAPMEEPSPVLTPNHQPETTSIRFAQQQLSTIYNTEAQAVAINPEQDSSRLIVLPLNQGGYNSDAPPHLPSSVVTEFAPPPSTNHQHFAVSEFQATQVSPVLSRRSFATNPGHHPILARPGNAAETLPPVDEKSQMMASGLAGAILGSLLLGPYVGIVAGFYTAYATQNTGATRDIAIALGDIALITRDKAYAIDEKHHIVVESKRLIVRVWEQALSLNRQHHISAKIKDFVAFSWREAVGFSRRNRVLERGIVGIGKGLEWLVRRLSTKPPAINYEDVPALSPAQMH